MIPYKTSHIRDHVSDMRSSYTLFFISNLQKSGHGEFANITQTMPRTATFVLCQIIFLQKSLEKTIPAASRMRTFEINTLILQEISIFSSILCSWHRISINNSVTRIKGINICEIVAAANVNNRKLYTHVI